MRQFRQFRLDFLPHGFLARAKLLQNLRRQPVRLIQQCQHEMFNLDLLMVALRGGALRLLNRFLRLHRQFIA